MQEPSPVLTSPLKKDWPAALIARTLAGSWRRSVTSPEISSFELAAISRLLIQSGAGALAWWRIRDSELATSDSATELHQVYRVHRLEASLHLRRIKYALGKLREVGIEPVLVKGWNVARLYPEPGLRHYLDVDLCVAAHQYVQATILLGDLEDGSYIDLHNELDHLDVMRWDEFFARTQTLRLEDTDVRVPCAEDHLRIVCVHWLRHGGWKPAGLCDVAAAIESLPDDFDWERCLGRDPVRANWVATAIRLAQELLGAKREEVSGKWEEGSAKRHAEPRFSTLTPYHLPLAPLPRWLVPAVLRQWSRSLSPNYREQALPSLLNQVTRRELAREIYSRWDQPVRATVAMRGRFNNWPRWPYQLGELLLHSSEVPKQLASMVRESLRSRFDGPLTKASLRLGSSGPQI